MTTKSDKKVEVRVSKTTESPSPIRKNIQFVDFSIVTAEQSKFIKLVDKAILSMIPESNLHLATYLNDLLGPSKREQQSNTFGFHKLKKCGKKEHHTIPQYKHEPPMH